MNLSKDTFAVATWMNSSKDTFAAFVWMNAICNTIFYINSPKEEIDTPKNDAH
jgi:hypothetical protein